mmetsp:Transcript_60506/g.129837  ORF Transcript_60506/g.129837 Transcript_60506/m.129837 type:complete len:269 (-) Transcript_60506:68-874(-)
MPVISVAKEDDGIAVVTIAKEPVNSMDLTLWQELLAALEVLEADGTTRGVIFRSGLKRSVFTAGLDLKELHAPSTSKERLFEMWSTLSKVLQKIYISPMVTAAAINGACPAGGCGLSLCCDYRVITADGSMGLNEVQLGIPVPGYWVELMASVVGQRQAEKVLMLGELPPADKLLQMSMVDVVVDSGDKVLPAALAEVRRWLKNPDPGRVATKQSLRGSLAERWKAGTQEEAGSVWAAISAPSTVASLTQVMERLSGGKKPPAKASKL